MASVTEMSCLAVLEAGSLRPRCRQDWFLPRPLSWACRGLPSPCVAVHDDVLMSLFSLKYYLLAALGLAAVRGLSLEQRGLLSGCGVRVSGCSGFPCCRARVPRLVAFRSRSAGSQ